jgi:hypothetical protein
MTSPHERKETNCHIDQGQLSTVFPWNKFSLSVFPATGPLSPHEFNAIEARDRTGIGCERIWNQGRLRVTFIVTPTGSATGNRLRESWYDAVESQLLSHLGSRGSLRVSFTLSRSYLDASTSSSRCAGRSARRTSVATTPRTSATT